jgi:hypothetical protein
MSNSAFFHHRHKCTILKSALRRAQRDRWINPVCIAYKECPTKLTQRTYVLILHGNPTCQKCIPLPMH